MSILLPEEIPVDLSYLDLRFLPFYLTAERVKIEWRVEHEDFLIISKNVKSFYVGLNLIHTHQEPGRIMEPHHLVFRRMRNKNSIRGRCMHSNFIENIIGLGIHNQSIYAGMSMDQIIEFKLSNFSTIRENYNWINYEEFGKALIEFDMSTY